MNSISKTVIVSAMFGLIACGGKKEPEQRMESESLELAETVDEVVTDVPIGKPTYVISDGQSVSFGNIKDGDILESPFTMKMIVQGMELEPKGNANEGKGHHHLIINGSFVPMGDVVPTGETSIHYGDGRAEAELELAAGEYTLTLQFADGLHQSYGEEMSSTINVVVE